MTDACDRPRITYAFCTHNRATLLPALVAALRAQHSPVPMEILAINNASSDDTAAVLAKLATGPGTPLRVVHEPQPGIVPARNRAIAESLDRELMLFIDDDELPDPGTVAAAWHAIHHEGADCVGGRIRIDPSPHVRPEWLDDEIAAFLAAIDYGPEPFWITSTRNPLWTGNIGYRMALFRDDPSLHFRAHLNRVGTNPGGGEDAAMFEELLERGCRIRYAPAMAVSNRIEADRLRQRYFRSLHFRAGLRQGRHQLAHYPKQLFGMPPFLLAQFARAAARAGWQTLRFGRRALRAQMTAAHALGCCLGYRQRRQPSGPVAASPQTAGAGQPPRDA